MKKPDIDDADIAKFLSDTFTDIRRTIPVSEGMESEALAFRDGHLPTFCRKSSTVNVCPATIICLKSGLPGIRRRWTTALRRKRRSSQSPLRNGS